MRLFEVDFLFDNVSVAHSGTLTDIPMSLAYDCMDVNFFALLEQTGGAVLKLDVL